MVDIYKLLGQHDWKIILLNPSEEEKGRKSDIYCSRYNSIEEVQKAGACKVLVGLVRSDPNFRLLDWKRIDVEVC